MGPRAVRGLPCLGLTAILLAAAPTGPIADTVVLQGGRRIAVDACHRQGAELRCRTPAGMIGIPADQVVRLEKSPQVSRPPRSAPPASPPRATRPSAELAPDPTPTPAGEPVPSAAQARIDSLEWSLTALTGDEAAAARRELALLHAWLGNVRMRARDYGGAETRYRSALDRDPTLMVARLNLVTALINMSRLADAETMLTGVLADHPDHPRALELLGEVALQTGRIDQSIELWERALALKPSGSLEGRLARARRLREAEEGFQRSDAAHFTLRFDGGEASPDLAGEILAALEEIHADLARRLLHEPPAVIQVTLYSREVFHAATESPDWVGGLFDGQLRIPVGGVTRLTPRLRRVLVHELTHAFVASRTHGSAPKWLQEGIAQVMEGRSSSGSRSAILQAYEVLGAPAGGPEFTYPNSLSQVEFLLETWSVSHLNDLLDRLGRGDDIEAAVAAVTGLSWPEFHREWAEWLGR